MTLNKKNLDLFGGADPRYFRAEWFFIWPFYLLALSTIEGIINPTVDFN
jgi:hypothetical protein